MKFCTDVSIKFSTKRISRIFLFQKIKNTAADSALYTERPSYNHKLLKSQIELLILNWYKFCNIIYIGYFIMFLTKLSAKYIHTLDTQNND